jgi:oligopeptidase A
MTDLALHHDYDPDGTQSPFALQHRIAERTTTIPPLPEDRFLCGFTHIFGGGYAAGYYSYKWAEVLSADAFGAFEEAGLDDPAAIARTGRRFRDTVLALGGSRHPMEVFEAFRGRAPTTEALLRHSGLVPKAA